MRQLGLAELDQALHTDYDPDSEESPDAFARRVLEPFEPTAVTDDDAMIATFSHVFGHPMGYACGYYAYRWADVVAADVFERFEIHGILDREQGRRVCEELLMPGNTRTPRSSIEALLGRAPRTQPFVRREGLV